MSYTPAATNIQNAIDICAVGNTVLVSNGVYVTGGRATPGASLTNRIVVTNAIIVRSVNGLSNTVICGQGPRGDNAVRCAYLANGAMLCGFTLSNGCTRTSGDYSKDMNGGGIYAANAVVSNCLITGNSASSSGGGTYDGTVNNCTITGNSAFSGGGIGESAANNCTIAANSASYWGGGTSGGIANNCTITGNLASNEGGGTCLSTVNNCTITGNLASNEGGGTYDAWLVMNCIVYYNTAPNGANDYDSGPFIHCCTTPKPDYPGNITNEPMFVDAVAGNLRLSSNSTCINAGINQTWMIGTVDLDGKPRIIDGVVDIGAYEWSTRTPIHYVSLSGAHVAPFLNWRTAATNIQAAIEVAEANDTVLVANGIYETGGRIAGEQTLTNRVVIDKPITMLSVNGPVLTTIRGSEAPGGGNGAGAIRCVYMTDGTVLAGFTLAHGHTRIDGDLAEEQSGGGVWCESASAVLSNCVLTGNSASWVGGGASKGTLFNCVLAGNSAFCGGGASEGAVYNCALTDNSAKFGGGICFGSLYNCTILGNSADYSSGGAFYGASFNCIVYYNTAPNEANYSGGMFKYCCTAPNPGYPGNITNEPMFVDVAAGNLRLLSNSPCINTGTNQTWMIGATDLDGYSRIYGGGRVDIGAYEYQSSFSVIPTNWLAQHGLPIDGSDDHGDADMDGMDNWQEWRCNTDPTNGTSFLGLTQPFTISAPREGGLVLRWRSEEGLRYRLDRSTNLFTDEFGYPVRTNIPTTPPINSETDTTAVGSGPWFYRVGVE